MIIIKEQLQVKFIITLYKNNGDCEKTFNDLNMHNYCETTHESLCENFCPVRHERCTFDSAHAFAKKLIETYTPEDITEALL